MRVEGMAALAWRRGRYLGLPTLRGPRPAPLSLGTASATLEDFSIGADFGADFRCRPRLHTFDEAYLIMGHGDDGAILNKGRELIFELCCYTQMGQRRRPFDLEVEDREEVLENVVVGVDGASRNYYHWMINALGRSRLCAAVTPEATVILPDFHLAGDQQGQVKGVVLQASVSAVLGDCAHRLMPPGAYRVRNLSVLWTRPTAPTDITGVKPLYDVFDGVTAQFGGWPKRRPRRLYLSRRAAHDPRLPEADAPALARVLDRHGFEVLALEDMSFEAQVRAAAEAEIIVAPHGAGLTNLVFTHRDAVVIELVARLGEEASFRPWYYQLASSRGQRYGAIKIGAEGWLGDLDAALRRCLR